MIRFVSPFMRNFLGSSPAWYKITIIAFLAMNPILLKTAGPFVTGWVLVAQFIFTLAMALKCYPLQPGGLLALEAVVMGMASPESVYQETNHNFPVILLLMFMVAGIGFMKEFLLLLFTNMVVRVRSKIVLSLLFCMVGACLAAFLDALTVIAVVITVAAGFYGTYHRYASSQKSNGEIIHHKDDSEIHEDHRQNLQEFRGFLRNLLMHAAVGTTLGGVMTLVGQPQNLIIGRAMDWHFMEFFLRMLPVAGPTFIAGVITCVAVEKVGLLGYGYKLPDETRAVLEDFAREEAENRDGKVIARLWAQGAVGLLLVLALAFHIAEVGLIGLAIIILLTAITGITDEHRIGQVFTEAMPFAALLVVFFAVVAVIHEQSLFKPVLDWAISLHGNSQLLAFFISSGALSSVSDNVFVGTIFISEAESAFKNSLITRDQFDLIAVAINAGTNIPSIATPNGQAAFLFLLTSSIASLIRLSYMRMLILALPYTITMTATAFLMVWLLL